MKMLLMIFWASLEPETVVEDGVERQIHELFLPKGQVTVVPTGVASAMLKKFALNFTNEKKLYRLTRYDYTWCFSG